MNDLVILKNNQAVCNSLEVAEKFRKRHTHVLQSIEKIIADSPAEKSARCFKKSSYKDEQGKPRPMYEMNRQGFSILAMGFTGKQALEWKWKYSDAFDAMENFIREKCSVAGIEARANSKIARKEETDVIKQYIEYAKAQGSQHANHYYSNITNLENKAVGITDRELATIQQLNQLTMIENIIVKNIKLGMEQEQPYKAIFQNCKAQVELFRKIAFIGIS